MPTTFVSDDFARTSSSSWGSADTGGAYTLVGTASDFNVSGGWGTISTPVNVTRRADLNATDLLETDWLFKLKVSAIPVGGNLAVYGYVRGVDNNNSLRATVRFKPTGNITLALDKFIGSVVTSNVQTGGAEYDTGIAPAAGTTYWLRVQAIAANPTTLRARVWVDGNTEPTSWQVSGTVSDAAVQVASSVEVGTFAASAITNAPITVSFGNARGIQPESVVLGTLNDFLLGVDDQPVFLDEPTVTAGGPQALAGTSAGTSTTTGDLTVAHPLDGTTAGTSTTTGALTVAHPLAGTSAGSSTTVGDLIVTHPLTGTSAGASTSTGNITGSFTLAGTSAGAGTTTGAVTVAVGLAGSSTGSSTTTGDLTVRQILRPSTDSVDGAWTTDSGATTLAAAIDEITASDSDYIRSEVAPATSACRIKLAAGNDPLASTGHVIRWRAGKDSTGAPQVDLTVALRQGGGDLLGAGTLIASFGRTDVDAVTTFEETLSGAQADAINDYGDLYLEFTANQV